MSPNANHLVMGGTWSAINASGIAAINFTSGYGYNMSFDGITNSTAVTLLVVVQLRALTGYTVAWGRTVFGSPNHDNLKEFMFETRYLSDYDSRYGYGFQALSPTPLPPTNAWCTIAFTKSGLYGKWYINGVLASPKPHVAARAITYGFYDLMVGADVRDADKYMNANIAFISAWKKTVDELEMFKIHTQYAGIYSSIPKLSGKWVRFWHPHLCPNSFSPLQLLMLPFTLLWSCLSCSALALHPSNYILQCTALQRPMLVTCSTWMVLT